MKKLSQIKLFILLVVFFTGVGSYAQNPINWTEKQLMEPAQLANAINTNKDVPAIISVGPGANIPNTLHVGMVNTAEGLEKLKTQLKTMDKDKKVVVYCGCCPYEHCPNVRPAINALKELKFTNYYLLNIPTNMKKDWIDQGFPITK